VRGWRPKRYPKALWYLRFVPPSVWVSFTGLSVAFLPLLSVAAAGPASALSFSLAAWTIWRGIWRTRRKKWTAW
jgi:hypothetical protein